MLITIWAASSLQLLQHCLLVHLCMSFSKEQTRSGTLLDHAKLFSKATVTTYNPNKGVCEFLLLCMFAGIWYCWTFNFYCFIDVHLFVVLTVLLTKIEYVYWSSGYPSVLSYFSLFLNYGKIYIKLAIFSIFKYVTPWH